jgi:uncharacterized protein YqgC (DUF456 family)
MIVGEAIRITVLVLALITMLIGIIGTVLPILPGTILIFVAALLYALVEGFQAVGWPTLVLLGVLAALATTADIWVSSIGAKMGGASGWSVVVGLFGGLAGLLLFNLPGAILGAILGVLLTEIIRVGDWRRALKAGSGWMIGWLLSTVFQLGMGLIMVAVFVWQLVEGS